MEVNELKNVIEALLLSSQEAMTPEQLQEVFDEWQRPELSQIKDVITLLQTDYATRSFELIQVASGYQIQTKSLYSNWVARLQIEKPSKYSRALLETLAIIAYKQPVTRADIEEIRGVAVNSHIMKTLMEREWIRIAGYKDVAGKPAVYTTTKEFLNYFNLSYLHELPTLPEVMETMTLHNANQSNEECNTE
ncbi:SMC-Scp complex subunit ScpB [Legionella worsleiensis]|uniref:Segregation and condensation protein B n=1 Tax=Legionella worsleiensis TaxID=45076 RepID=A0A0W1A6V7_9GAMM|nr:SMC-Scp complex subunit ScpB [Legionella worsleiensis]KTD76912.1 segregation and condensation protein B [Legionella worsleiensis]STY33418.1 segregation and condensation protein B [Legionella worsleiensis]